MTTNKRVDALNTVQRNGLMPPSNTKDSSFASPPSFTEQKEGVGRGVAHAGQWAKKPIFQAAFQSL